MILLYFKRCSGAIALLPFTITGSQNQAFAQARPAPPPRAPVAMPGTRGASAPVVLNVDFEMNIQKGLVEKCPLVLQVLEELDAVNDVSRVLITGEAPLHWLAGSFQLSFHKPRMARWTAPLTADFKECVASGVVSAWNGRKVRTRDKHLQVFLNSGLITLDLNLNGFPSGVLIHKADVNKNGKPVWSWGKIVLKK